MRRFATIDGSWRHFVMGLSVFIWGQARLFGRRAFSLADAPLLQEEVSPGISSGTVVVTGPDWPLRGGIVTP